MTAGPYAVVARVLKTHGLKGEVSVAPVAEAPFSVLTGLEVWFVPPAGALRSATIGSTRPVAKGELVTFVGVDSIQTASALVGRDVLARAEALPSAWTDSLTEDVDEVGFMVTDATRGPLGVVDEVIHTGANDVWVVHGSFGEVLIPVIDDVVIGIDDDLRSIEVRLLPGLLPTDGETV